MINKQQEEGQHESLVALIHAESVLQKRIHQMKAGAPMSAAKERLEELKWAIKLITKELAKEYCE